MAWTIPFQKRECLDKSTKPRTCAETKSFLDHELRCLYNTNVQHRIRSFATILRGDTLDNRSVKRTALYSADMLPCPFSSGQVASVCQFLQNNGEIDRLSRFLWSLPADIESDEKNYRDNSCFESCCLFLSEQLQGIVRNTREQQVLQREPWTTTVSLEDSTLHRSGKAAR